MAPKIRTRRRGGRHLRQGQGQDRQGPARRPQAATASTSRASTSSSATSARCPAARTPQVGRDREGGRRSTSPTWRSSTPRTRSRRASASTRSDEGARMRVTTPLRERSSTDMARPRRTATTSEIRPALIERFGYSTPMQAPRLVKITLNMGVGEAKQDSKMLEAAQEQLADDRRPEAEHPPRAQVRRRVQAARGHAGRPDRHAARRARVRVPRPPGLGRDPAHPRLPRAEPALVRRPRELLAWASASRSSSPRSTTTTSTRSAGSTSRSPRPRRPTPRRSRCSRRSACRSPATGARRASRA